MSEIQKAPIPNHHDFGEERLEPATAGKFISTESNCQPVAWSASRAAIEHLTLRFLLGWRSWIPRPYADFLIARRD